MEVFEEKNHERFFIKILVDALKIELDKLVEANGKDIELKSTQNLKLKQLIDSFISQQKGFSSKSVSCLILYNSLKCNTIPELEY